MPSRYVALLDSNTQFWQLALADKPCATVTLTNKRHPKQNGTAHKQGAIWKPRASQTKSGVQGPPQWSVPTLAPESAEEPTLCRHSNSLSSSLIFLLCLEWFNWFECLWLFVPLKVYCFTFLHSNFVCNFIQLLLLLLTLSKLLVWTTKTEAQSATMEPQAWAKPGESLARAQGGAPVSADYNNYWQNSYG